MSARLVRLIRSLYGWLVARYPLSFREAFAAEMQTVFALLLAEAASHGLPAVARLLWRELGGLVAGLMRERGQTLRGSARRLAASLGRGLPLAGLVPGRLVGSPGGVAVATTLTWLPAALVLVLLALAPLAMAQTPYERIYTDGVYQAPHPADPRYPLRAGLIGLGLLAPLVCLGCTGLALAAGRRHAGRAIVSASLTLCAATIGWRCFPYWVNGVYQAMLGQAPMTDLDPKALLPAAWIGHVWVAGVLLLYPIAWLGGLGLVGAACWVGRRQGWRPALVTMAVVAVALATFLITPRYSWWLMD
jgi:hypothetical protein